MFNRDFFGVYLTPRRRRWVAAGLTLATLATMGGVVVASTQASNAAPAQQSPALFGGRSGGGNAARTDASFQAICSFSHRNNDDPIVVPGQPGKSHTHDFYGATTTDAFSTADTLRSEGATSCNNPFDKAGYWVANLRKNGQPLTASRMITTYQARFKRKIQPFPAGLEILSGDANAKSAQPLSTITWSCNDDVSHASSSVIPSCPNDDKPLTLTVWFPDCWNGSDLDSADHHSHMAFSEGGKCPSDHPVPVPGLKETVFWPEEKSSAGLTLASGGTLTGHGDFINSWNQGGHAAFVNQFLNLLNSGNVLGGVLNGPLRDVIGQTAGPQNRPEPTAQDKRYQEQPPMGGMAGMGN